MTNYKLYAIARKMLKAGYKKHRVRVSTRVLDEKALEMSQIMFIDFSEKYPPEVVDSSIDELYEAYNFA